MFTLRINTSNLIENVQQLTSKTKAEFCAVVKANAYGHGLEMARYLDKYVSCYAVACGNEALILRGYTKKPIYVLSPSEDIGKSDIIYSVTCLKDLIHKRVCVKINTGMNRLGILPSQSEEFVKYCLRCKISIDSIYTHFSDVNYAPVQFERFMSVNADFKRHACASNFLQLSANYHLDMVRCGLAMYGYCGMKPILSAYAQVYNVVKVKKGEKIGYKKEAKRDMTVAIVGVGYADALKRQEQAFFVDEKVCFTVGDICMDMCLIDVSGLDVKPGDTIEYLGAHICAEDVAKRNNTIVYDILTSFGSRCRRVYE